MSHSQSARLHEGPASTARAAEDARADAAPERFSLLRLSAADRALRAIFVIALLWAGVYWALH